MALDLEAVRRRLAELDGTAKKGGGIFWRPQPGEYIVRMLPWTDNQGQPFKELYFYYGIGAGKKPPALLSLSQYKQPDPVQELINELRGDPDNRDLLKRLYPKMRAFVPVVVRSEEGENVRLWGFGKQIYQKMLGWLLDSEIGDFTDPSTGYDVKIKITQAAGKDFADTEVDLARKPSILSKDPAQAKKWLENIPDPKSAYQLLSYDDMKKRVDEWLAAGAGAPTTNETTERGGSPAANGASDLDTLAEELAKPAAKATKVEEKVEEKTEAKAEKPAAKPKAATKTADVDEDLDKMMKELEG